MALRIVFRSGSAHIFNGDDCTQVGELYGCDNIFAVTNFLRKLTDKSEHWKSIGWCYERQPKRSQARAEKEKP